jgi:hypothetical protein
MFTPKPKKEGQYLAACKKCTYELYTRSSSIKRLSKQGKAPRKILNDSQRKESKKNSMANYFQSKKGKEAKKRYYQSHKAEISSYNKAYKQKNKKPTVKRVPLTEEQKKANRQAYYQRTKAAPKPKKTRTIEQQIESKIKKSLRRRLRKALKGNVKTGTIAKQIGCTSAELRLHLENQFTNGMTWNNYGEWHIDHIRPMCSFELSKVEDLNQVNHYSNLRPLWAEDNLAKSLDDIKLKMTANK